MNPVVFLLGCGHLVVDAFQGALPLLLPLLKQTFDLSYAAVGAVMLGFTATSSVMQPLFGTLGDRAGSWLVLPAGCALAGVGIAVVGLAPQVWLVTAGVVVCGLGVAAYHPEGARITFFAAPGHRRATTMALFGVCGNVGWGLGPAAAALLVGAAGREGAAGLVVPGLLMALVLLVYRARLARSAREQERRHRRTRPAENEGKPHWEAAAVLVLVVAVSYWAYVGSATYIPLYYTAHLGADPSRSGFVLSLFLLGGAAGTLAGGWLSDRRGRRPVMQGALALSVLPLLLFPQAGGAGSVVLAGLAGFVLGSIWGVATVYAQELLPHHPGLAAGLVHGLPAGLGGLATLFLGLVADRWGVPIAMTVLALLPVPGLFLSFRLPGPDRRAARASRRHPKPSNSG